MTSSGIFRFSIFVAVAALAVLDIGAVVTNQFASGTALAPPLSTTAFAIHRHGGETIALLVLLLAIWITTKGSASGVPGIAKTLSWAAVAGVIGEAVLGSSSVPLSAALAFVHAFLGQFVFGTVVSITVLVWPAWGTESGSLADQGWPSVRSLSRITVYLLVVQIILGAAFRHNFAGVLWHILGAFLVVLFGVALLVLLTQTQGSQSLRPAVITLGVLLGIQVTLGMVLISISDQSKHPALVLYSTVAHVLTGASIFAVTIITAMLIRRAVGEPLAKTA